MTRIAIIGAGLTGLVLAGALHRSHDVTIYEKSRGFGGRLATRRSDGFEFDHGAQYFRAKSDAFGAFLAPLIAAGVVAPWRGRFTQINGEERAPTRTAPEDDPYYVGVPSMNAVGKHLAATLDGSGQIRLRTRVTAVERSAGHWRVTAIEHGVPEPVTETFDWLLITAPLTQSASLLKKDRGLCDAIGDRRMPGCYTLMLGFDTLPELSFDAATVLGSDVAWIAANSSKPGRPSRPTLVVQSSNSWAEENMARDVADVGAQLLAETARITDRSVISAIHQSVHRWRYANAPASGGANCYIDAPRQLGVAGDGWIRGRVESAFLSATALLEALQETLSRQ